jgi:23S rRNA (guanosine2251-2'-O)-methyltransferase
MKTEGKVVALYGVNPLKEFLQIASKLSTGDFSLSSFLVKVTREAEGRANVMSLIQRYHIKHMVVTREEIEHGVGKGALHQGILFELPASLLYGELAHLLESEKKKDRSLLLLLDELEDPHNLGAIIRSAASFGASGILLPEHDQIGITGTVVKTASGMNFMLPICQIGNVNTMLEKLKKEGYWIYGLDSSGKESLPKISFDDRTVLVIGSEGKGIREKTKELCDFLVSIPINASCESLNASVAASVALYEWKRQGGK